MTTTGKAHVGTRHQPLWQNHIVHEDGPLNIPMYASEICSFNIHSTRREGRIEFLGRSLLICLAGLFLEATPRP